MQNRSLFKTAMAFLAATLGVLLLVYANGATRDVRHDLMPLALLAVSFQTVVVVLTLTAMSARMQLGLQMLAIYFAVYLLLPGFNHMSRNTFPFYNMHYAANIRVQTGVIVAAFLAAVLAAYSIVAIRGTAAATRVVRRGRPARFRPNPRLTVLLLLACVPATLAYLDTVGLAGAFRPRAATGVRLDAIGVALRITLPQTVTFLSLLYAVLLLRFSSDRRAGLIVVLLNLPIFLTTNWPLSLPRFIVFGQLLVLTTLWVDFRPVRARATLGLLFMAGALIVMPVFDSITRHGRSLADVRFGESLETYFRSGDFDGVQSINNAVLFHEGKGPQYGRQLASAMLFFVPRSVWSGKSDPTGTMTARFARFRFTNISQPLPSEFYVDFGMAGVLVGGLLVGFGLARIDRWIDAHWHQRVSARLVAGIVVGYSLIVYRGTLLGVMPPVVILGAGMWLIARFGVDRRRLRLPAPAPASLPAPALRPYPV